MAIEVIAIESKTGPRLQRDVVTSDTGTDQRALFPNSQDSNNTNRREASNCIMVGTVGNVKVRLVKGVDASGAEVANVDDVLPNLVPGVWHVCAPFDHVYTTGTTATAVKIGVT